MSKTNSVKTFSVGDLVSWQSQASGHWKKKTGTVVEIVAARRTPKKMKRRNLSPRAGESYVVEVDVSPKKGGSTKMECYWPLVRNLRLVKRGSTSAVAADPAPEVIAAADEIANRPDGIHKSAGAAMLPDPVAQYVEAEEKQSPAGLERFCDPDALGDAAQAGLDRLRDQDLSGNSNSDVASGIN